MPFADKAELWSHEKEVHGEDTGANIIKCDLCNKLFESANGLAIHKSFAHEKPEVKKEFNCLPCDIKVWVKKNSTAKRFHNLLVSLRS